MPAYVRPGGGHEGTDFLARNDDRGSRGGAAEAARVRPIPRTGTPSGMPSRPLGVLGAQGEVARQRPARDRPAAVGADAPGPHQVSVLIGVGPERGRLAFAWRP